MEIEGKEIEKKYIKKLIELIFGCNFVLLEKIYEVIYIHLFLGI